MIETQSSLNKTRLVPFQKPDRVDDDEDGPGTFNLLGFTTTGRCPARVIGS